MPQKASELSLEYSKQTFLFKGPPGFGKTLAAASFALDGPTYLAYWDKKDPVELVTFFRGMGEQGKRILDNLEYDCYGSGNANEYLNFLINLAKNGCRYTTLINDSLTYMTSACVNWSLNFGKSDKERRKITDILPSWDEYKAETSMVSQCIDITKKLNCHSIWTAHPLPTTKVEGGSGASMRVTKTNSLVSYGSKVAGMVPGGFTEIYHFGQQLDYDNNTAKTTKKYIIELDAVGDEFAKSPMLGHAIKTLEYTNKPFYEVWKAAIAEHNPST